MSIKNKLILTIAGVASLMAPLAFAGGAEAFVPLPASSRYFFLQGNLGFGESNWRSLSGPFAPLQSHVNNGLTFGFDGGVMFSRYFGLELGWYDLPRASARGSGIFPFG